MSHPSGKSKSGEMLFILLFFIFAAVLLSQLGEQTKFSSKGKLFAQPAFWPAVGVIGMVGFTGLHLLVNFKNRASEGLGAEVTSWLRGLEYVVWFMLYVLAVPRIGYLPSTVAFTLLLAWRMGYRKASTLLYSGLSGFCIVLIFKTLLSVKIPGGAVYEYLPDAIRNFMIINF